MAGFNLQRPLRFLKKKVAPHVEFNQEMAHLSTRIAGITDSTRLLLCVATRKGQKQCVPPLHALQES